MKKILSITAILTLAVILYVTPASAAGTVSIDIQGTKIEATLVDDFSSYAEETKGSFTYEDETLSALVNAPYAEDYSLPLANKEQTKGAKYVGLKVSSDADDIVYFSLQGHSEGTENYFLTKEGIGDPILLVSKDGSVEKAVTCETKFNGRYCIEITEVFDGYIIIPTNRVATISNIDKQATWGANSAYTTLGIYMQSDVTDVTVVFDDFFVFNGTLPEIKANPTATPAPATKAPTQAPKTSAPATAAPATSAPAATTAPTETAEAPAGLSTGLIIGIVAAVVVIAAAAVYFLVAKKKAAK